MNVVVAELANVVFKKPLHECSVYELQHLAQQFPYFGPAQLLLAKKLTITSVEQGGDSSPYEEQLQKTLLYFQNRVWLDYLLKDSDNRKPVFDLATIVEEEEEAAVENKEQYHPGEFVVSENNEEVSNQLVEEKATEQTEVPVEIPVTNIEPVIHPVISENNGIQSILEPDEEDATENATEKTTVPFEMPALKIEPVRDNAGVIFEPFHTVDYFASQGIKFKDDERPKDRFSAQLKSFTEWLRMMKRIPVTDTTASDSIGEKKVEQMAEFSVAERHVVTEAMAEVWQKQGNKAKAEDIYRKLSLLDPSKSSYFAMKIEELKKHV
jgi:hypothetical protein